MSWITDKRFWVDTGERTVSSAAQGFIAGATLDAIAVGPEVVSLDLGTLAAAGGIGAAIMAALTLAKCVAAGGLRRDNVPAVGVEYRPRRAADAG